jgi:two-component system, chemotaxis family, protein-glutamate methylesterase/glutaminase
VRAAMQIKVLVVDDSRFYRNRLCEILALDQGIQVVGTAENGREAIDKALSLKPDVITMDIEMPVMDGISSVREIMKIRPTPILMFSSLTTEGAQATFDALDAGAVDFLLKRLDKLSYKNTDFSTAICHKIRVLGNRAAFIVKQSRAKTHAALLNTFSSRAESSEAIRHKQVDEVHSGKYKIVVIGASTGGPVAVQSIMSVLPGDFSVPILIVQHMPAAFTSSFARRLDSLSRVNIKEAEDGDVLQAGKVYVAPGGKQMFVEGKAAGVVVRIRNSYEGEQYKPSVDITYKSVSDIFGSGALAIVLTGMGTDGREGATLLKKCGSAIWAQDEQTSVIYGMPQAVIEAGLADRILPINDIAHQLALGV